MGPSKSTSSKFRNTTKFPPHWAYAHRLVPSVPMVRSAIWATKPWLGEDFGWYFGMIWIEVQSSMVVESIDILFFSFFWFDDWCELILMFRKAWKFSALVLAFPMMEVESYDKIHQNPQIECWDYPITRGLGALEKSARKKQPCFNKQAKHMEKSQLLFPPIFLSNSLGCPDKITIFRPTSWGQVVIKTLISSKTSTLRSQTYSSFGLTPFKDSKSSIIITLVTWLHVFLEITTLAAWTWHLGKVARLRVFPSSDHQLSMLLMFATESTLLPHPSLAPMAKRSASSGKRHWAWGNKMLQANWTFANCNVPRRPHLSSEKTELYTYPAALSLHCQTCRRLVLQHRSHVDCRLKWLKRLMYLLNRLWWSPMSLQTFHLRSAPTKFQCPPAFQFSKSLSNANLSAPVEA